MPRLHCPRGIEIHCRSPVNVSAHSLLRCSSVRGLAYLSVFGSPRFFLGFEPSVSGAVDSFRIIVCFAIPISPSPNHPIRNLRGTLYHEYDVFQAKMNGVPLRLEMVILRQEIVLVLIQQCHCFGGLGAHERRGVFEQPHHF